MATQKERKAEYDSEIAALKGQYSEELNRVRDEASHQEKELTGLLHERMAELAAKKEELGITTTGKPTSPTSVLQP